MDRGPARRAAVCGVLVALVSGCNRPDRQPLGIVAEEICTTGTRACARMDDGTVLCWRKDGGVTALDVGATRLQCGVTVCIETEDQEVDCYDWDMEPLDSDIDRPDPSALPFKDWWESKYANGVHGCGLTMDDTVSCWGYSWNTDGFESALTDLSVQQIAFTDECNLVLDDAGRIHSVLLGENCAGYKDWHNIKGDYANRAYLDYPPFGPGFTQISGGDSHACAIGSEGGVTCFGMTYRAVPPDGVRFTQIDSTEDSNCGVTTDTTIACWSSPFIDDRWLPPTTPGWKQVVIDRWQWDPYSDEPDLYVNVGWALSETGEVVSIADPPYGWSTYDDAVLEWVGP